MSLPTLTIQTAEVDATALADRLGVSRKTVYGLVARRLIPFRRATPGPHGRLRFRLPAVLDALRRQGVEPPEALTAVGA